MKPSPPDAVMIRIRKLASLPEEIRQSRWAIAITRLTVLKSLCHEPEIAYRFVTYIARTSLDNPTLDHGRTPQTETLAEANHEELMIEALDGMERWLRKPTDELRFTLTELRTRMREVQSEYKRSTWGAVRLITDQELLLFEYALSCLLARDTEVGWWAYQTARHYAEQYDPSQGTGLISSSIPQVQVIVGFWMTEYALTAESLLRSRKTPKSPSDRLQPSETGKKTERSKRMKFTNRQGQFLAFIHLYWKLHRRGPAETDLGKFFRVSPPAVHGMVVKLEELGLITREPGIPRSMRVVPPSDELPNLEDVSGPPW